MRVLYDHQILYLQKYGGISRYFYELISSLRLLYPKDIYKVKAVISQNYYFKDMVPQRKIRKHGNKWFNETGVYLELAGSRLLGKGVDIFHPTYYDTDYISGKMKGNMKTVITVHDMTHERFMAEDPQYDQASVRRTIELKKRAMETADAIITVSEATKKDMLMIYPGLVSKPVRVIHHGYDALNTMSYERPDPETGPEAFAKGRYVLFVGERKGYKRFDSAIKAVGLLGKEHEDISILCAGGGKLSAKESELVRENGLENKVIQKNMTDEELMAAYRNAVCFIYPSECEGFGIPVIEAFRCSCPVILRRTSCFPEVAGEAALYFENEEELAERIRSIASGETKKKMTEAGRERLNLFSWEKTARQTHDLYLEVSGS